MSGDSAVRQGAEPPPKVFYFTCKDPPKSAKPPQLCALWILRSVILEKLIIYVLIILVPFVFGKISATINKPFFKKYIRFGHHENATDRMVNNYWGNMISVAGIIFLCSLLFGIKDMTVFAISAISIAAAYIIHVSDATGLSTDESISCILEGKNKPALQYMRGTLCFILAILITGVLNISFVSKMLFP